MFVDVGNEEFFDELLIDIVVVVFLVLFFGSEGDFFGDVSIDVEEGGNVDER